MSWSGFKKNVGRATTQVMMKTGHVEKTSDREYEVEERRYRTLESASLRLQKEAKGYLDSLRAMTASQMRIAETIDAFYGESGAKDGVSRSYKQAVEDLDAETVKALDGPYRCVSREPHLRSLAEEISTIRDPDAVLVEIESELNWKAGRRRTFTQDSVQYSMAMELIESVCRTTVLEPINRFCAYFPDINECIKKRNHKMLDYDAMRSKVKKLTEKPDKDPSKLPRTEKETEMVMNPLIASVHSDSTALDGISVEDGDLLVPSLPKVLDGLEHGTPLDRIIADEDAALRSVGVKRKGSIRATASRWNRAFWALPPQDASRVPKGGRLLSLSSASLRSDKHRDIADASSTNALASMPSFSARATGTIAPLPPASSPSPTFNPKRTLDSKDSLSRMASMSPRPRASLGRTPSKRSFDSQSTSITKNLRSRTDFSKKDSHYSLGPSVESDATRRSSAPIRNLPSQTAFFHPSELEDILAPLKEEFVERQADRLAQAKAAYDQLNEQLTNELPQLIDLRVPYLDPSFEALVKIQLRFCAEAYSRMAQVQQYLDASTRDQYANGDLDAKVEDVLGQIRELSIAGTV